MKLVDYINKCLKNDEFRKYWEEISIEQSDDEVVENKPLSTREALELLEVDSLDSIITNKGIKSTKEIPTTIEFYESDTSCPIENFLNSINNEKLRAKTLTNIVNLAKLGNNARPPLSEYVDDGIFELRTKQSSNITRVFYFFVFGNKIILTNGYIKKGQKLDTQEFEKAKAYRNDYLKKANKRR